MSSLKKDGLISPKVCNQAHFSAKITRDRSSVITRKSCHLDRHEHSVGNSRTGHPVATRGALQTSGAYCRTNRYHAGAWQCVGSYCGYFPWPLRLPHACCRLRRTKAPCRTITNFRRSASRHLRPRRPIGPPVQSRRKIVVRGAEPPFARTGRSLKSPAASHPALYPMAPLPYNPLPPAPCASAARR